MIAAAFDWETCSARVDTLCSRERLPANSVFASAPPHDMHVCAYRSPFGPSVPHPPAPPRPPRWHAQHCWCVSTGLCCVGSAMAWASAIPYFRPGHVPPLGQWVAVPWALGAQPCSSSC